MNGNRVSDTANQVDSSFRIMGSSRSKDDELRVKSYEVFEPSESVHRDDLNCDRRPRAPRAKSSARFRAESAQINPWPDRARDLRRPRGRPEISRRLRSIDRATRFHHLSANNPLAISAKRVWRRAKTRGCPTARSACAPVLATRYKAARRGAFRTD